LRNKKVKKGIRVKVYGLREKNFYEERGQKLKKKIKMAKIHNVK